MSVAEAKIISSALELRTYPEGSVVQALVTQKTDMTVAGPADIAFSIAPTAPLSSRWYALHFTPPTGFPSLPI